MSESEKREQAEFEYYRGEWEDELKKRGLQFSSHEFVTEDDKKLCAVALWHPQGVRFEGKGENWDKAFADAVKKFDVRSAGRRQEIVASTENSYDKVKKAAESGDFGRISFKELQSFIDNIQDDDFELAARVVKELERRK